MHSVKLLHEPLHLTEYKPKQEILRPKYEFHNAISCQNLVKLNKVTAHHGEEIKRILSLPRA